MTRFHPGLLISLTLAPILTVVAAEPDPRNAVVKVEASSTFPDVFRPWRTLTPSKATGSGVVIEGGPILTNANIVNYATEITVQPNGSTEKLNAAVRWFAQDCDLAVLELEDRAKAGKLQPMPLADALPPLQSKVVVMGYPEDSDALNTTEGTVTRIGYAPYYYGLDALKIELNATVNTGCSGGPAVADGKLVGVTFQIVSSNQDTGYLIPAQIVQHFLADCKADDHYNGFPTLLLQEAPLVNATLRRFLELPDNVTGCVINRVEDPALNGTLAPWDVITSCDGVDIDNDGEIALPNDLHVNWRHLLHRKMPGESVRLEVIRKSKPLTVTVPTTTDDHQLVWQLAGRRPSYFVYGGIVFSPLTQEMIGALRQSHRIESFCLLGYDCIKRYHDLRRFDDEELVVCTSTIDSDMTEGYEINGGYVLTSINDQPVRNLRHAAQIVADADGEFITFLFADRVSERIVLDRKQVAALQPGLLNHYHIAPCSEDLRDIWKAGIPSAIP